LSPNDRIELLSSQLRRAWAYKDSRDNLELQSRDEIIVFSQDENRADLLVPIIERLRVQARAGDPERVVVINGLVPYPGEYPLEGGMRVSDLIRAAGGLSQEAYGLEAEVSRFEIVAGKFSELRRIDVDLAALRRGESIADIMLQPFDTLNIKQVPEWRERQIVEVRGEVLFPGEYVIQKGETVRDVIYRAGGFTEHAFPRGAVFLRVDLKEKEQEQFDRLRERLKADLAAITLQRMNEDAATAEAVAMAESLLDQLVRTEAIGRMVIDLPRIMASDSDSSQNVALKNGDKLLIPDKPHSVTVLGEVNYATSHVFDPMLDRGDYVQRSGGFTTHADKSRIYVVRASGEVLGSSTSAWFASEQQIEVGDTIVVPLDADRIRPLTLWTSIAQIISQVALAAAAANAVGVFN
jgi:protein involved in polysaccharide export with SLBB domain